MKFGNAMCLSIAISLATGGLALAQGEGHRDGARHDNGRHNGRGGDERRDERGAGPDQSWHRGDRMPVEYRHRNYVVDDWRGHHLSAPPRGYYWVQNGSDYLLVAIASGVIAQLILGSR
jgi:Ni/Co efflux regulator RcnB